MAITEKAMASLADWWGWAVAEAGGMMGPAQAHLADLKASLQDETLFTLHPDRWIPLDAIVGTLHTHTFAQTCIRRRAVAHGAQSESESHPSTLIHYSSPLTPHPSPLTPHPSPLTPHPSPLTPRPSPLAPHPSQGMLVDSLPFALPCPYINI